MKKAHVVLLAATIVGITVLESCKKYEEGPTISFRSRKERVANTWKVEKYMVGGNDQTTSFNNTNPNYKIKLEKDGVAQLSYSAFGLNTTIDGTWDLITNDEELQTKFGNTTATSTILKLKEKELWLVDKGDANDPSDDAEMHLVPAE